MRYVLLQSSRRELAEAARWYEDRRDDLGEEFLAEFSRCVAFAVRRPNIFAIDEAAPLGYSVRHVPFRRFPYRIVYLVRNGTVVVLAVAHSARRPGYWLDRLTEEE